ncbi:class I SAM-dependent methyltransferase [Haloarcula halophila]|uniref:class I SAM-dependent methyltransferase n=1 Tax=Haloarcula TaxID=2237 RepID=UPI0023E430F0|nr:class I SAM-dependent methyltransferase [Halomicroarcula sp. DFY41]
MASDGFSEEWDSLWEMAHSYGKWPWTDVVALVNEYCSLGELRVLELGCGPGTNIPFFQTHDADYYAVEGSDHAARIARNRFPRYADQIAVADFTESIPFDGPFDLVLDRASLTANSTERIEQCLSMVTDRLRSDGHLICIDLYATDDLNYDSDGNGPDEYTRRGFEDGRFEGMGKIHFFDEDHLQETFDAFEPLHLTHTTEQLKIPQQEQRAQWTFVGTPVTE